MEFVPLLGQTCNRVLCVLCAHSLGIFRREQPHTHSGATHRLVTVALMLPRFSLLHQKLHTHAASSTTTPFKKQLIHH